jgi:hypothetical protein
VESILMLRYIHIITFQKNSFMEGKREKYIKYLHIVARIHCACITNFVCLFIVFVSSLIRQLQSGAQIYSYRNQENEWETGPQSSLPSDSIPSLLTNLFHPQHLAEQNAKRHIWLALV